jgi:hypothetical protein
VRSTSVEIFLRSTGIVLASGEGTCSPLPGAQQPPLTATSLAHLNLACVAVSVTEHAKLALFDTSGR